MDPEQRRAMRQALGRGGRRSAPAAPATSATTEEVAEPPAAAVREERAVVSLSIVPSGVDTEAETPVGTGFEATGIWSPELSPEGELTLAVAAPAKGSETAVREGEASPPQFEAEVPGVPPPRDGAEGNPGGANAEPPIPSSSAGEQPEERLGAGYGVLPQVTQPGQLRGQEANLLAGLSALFGSAAPEAALGLISQMGLYILRSEESATQLEEARASIKELQEERRRLETTVAQKQVELREARGVIERSEVAARKGKKDMEDLLRLMASSGEQEAELRRQLEESRQMVEAHSQEPPAGLKRKRGSSSAPAGGEESGEKTPPRKRLSGGLKRPPIQRYLRAAGKGVQQLELQLEKEREAHLAALRELAVERSRSATAEGKATQVARNLGEFAEELEPSFLAAVPADPAPESPRGAIEAAAADPDRQAGGAEGADPNKVATKEEGADPAP